MASAEALRLMNGKCSTLLNFRLQFSMARDLVEKRGKHWKRLLVCGLIFFFVTQRNLRSCVKLVNWNASTDFGLD